MNEQQVEVPKLIVVTFTFDMETKNGQYFGNIPPLVAVNILQQLGISLELKARQQEDGGEQHETPRVDTEPTA